MMSGRQQEVACELQKLQSRNIGGVYGTGDNFNFEMFIHDVSELQDTAWAWRDEQAKEQSESDAT